MKILAEKTLGGKKLTAIGVRYETADVLSSDTSSAVNQAKKRRETRFAHDLVIKLLPPFAVL